MHISMQYTTEHEWVSVLYRRRNSIVWYLDGQEVCGGDQCPDNVLLPNQLYPEMYTRWNAKYSIEIYSIIKSVC